MNQLIQHFFVSESILRPVQSNLIHSEYHDPPSVWGCSVWLGWGGGPCFNKDPIILMGVGLLVWVLLFYFISYTFVR